MTTFIKFTTFSLIFIICLSDVNDNIKFYKVLKETVLSSNQFQKFKLRKKVKSENLRFSKYENSICWYKRRITKKLVDDDFKKFCKLDFKQKKITDISKLNDRGKASFIITFSEVYKGIIVLEIAYNNKNPFEPSLWMIYRFNSVNNNFELLNHGVTAP